MARAKASGTATERRGYWSTEIDKGKKRFRTFWDEGDKVIAEYRQQSIDGNGRATKDKYNILYSSTETIRPNLYAQLPTVRVILRNKDTASPAARDGSELLQNCGQYLITEQDFDSTLENVTEDLLLPGLGAGWVRYEPTIEYKYEKDGKTPEIDPETGEQAAELLDEQVCLEYVYWKDFITGVARTWAKVPWVARCCWMTKQAATKRFGATKANKLSYARKERDGNETENTTDTAEIWEIWDKRTKSVYWFCDSYPEDLLDTREDPLKLKAFFPCPRPLRAVSTNDRIVPRALYSQYKDQAEQVNNLTRRIRLLTDALKVAGVFNGMQEKISDLISPLSGNKLIPIENWAGFKGDGGLVGAIEWLPISDVAAALNQLLQAREVAKNEIYEITGFSDVLRGVSKASETLGAQNIKANWGSARLKRMQKEVQRFARDMIAIAGEIVAEHCSDETIALFGGVEIPQSEDQAAVQAAIQRFQAAAAFIRNEGRRVAAIDIETDSTILADETAEREDRMAFLAAAGAFLQQAVPAMEATPELGRLLGAMLMFTVRTFPSSRVIEDAFEATVKAMTERPPQQPEENQPDQTKIQAAQIQAQTEQARIQAETQTKQAEIQAKSQYEQAKVQTSQVEETNRHQEKMLELQLKEREIAIREAELTIKEHEVGIKQQVADDNLEIAQAEIELDGAELAVDTELREAELAFERDVATVDAELREIEAIEARADQTPLTPKSE